MPRIQIKIIIVVLFLLLISMGLRSFSQRSNFTNYSLEDGLPQSTVLTLYQDHNRNLWLGTQGGICKYNGNSFVTYDTRHGLADNHISSILQDSKARLWIGHRYKGVTMKMGKEFKQISFVNSRINAIKEDAFGNIWFASLDSNIFILPSGLEPEIESLRKLTLSDYPDLNYVYELAIVDSNEVWAATYYGLRVIRFQNDSLFSITVEAPANGLLNTSSIFSIVESDNDVFWLLMPDRLVRVDRSGKDFSNVTDFPFNQDFVFNYISAISVDKEGNVWGSHNQGVFQFKDGSFRSFSKEDGILDSQINTVLCDVEGNVWIGATNAGVFKYSGDKFQVFDVSSGLPDNVILSVIEDVKGNIWMGTNSGVTIFDGDSLRPFALPGNIAGSAIGIIYQDSRENIWFSEFEDNDIVRYNSNTGRFRNFSTNDGLNTTSAIAISEDNQGHIWFGTLGISVGRYTYPTHNMPEKFDNFTEEDGLGSVYLWTIFRDRKGNLWFGSDNAGVTKYDGKTFITYNKEDGLNNLSAGAITDDKEGNIWIATIGGGVYKYDGNKFTNYGIEQGLSSDNPYTIISDQNDHIWVGTNTGIDRFDPMTETFKHYGKDEGFIGIENNQNAICKGRNGIIWFGTVNGLVRFDPTLDKPNLLAPKTLIENVKLFYEDIDFSNFTDSMDTRNFLPLNLELPYNKNHLTFEFSGVSLTVPGNVNYQYILAGFDPMWSPSSKSTIATYTNIPPGEYSFKVKACNNDNVWNDEPVEYSFVILPPFWQAWWFRLSVIALFLFGFFIYIKLRLNNIKSQKIKLEKLVAEKTTELQLEAEERKKALQKAEQADRLKTAFLANMSHEIRTPVNSIVGFADLLKDNNLGEDDRKLYLNYIINGGNSLMNLINDIIDISKIEAEQVTIVKEDCNLNSLMSELFMAFHEFKNKKGKENIDLIVKNDFDDKEISILTDRFRLQQILSNLIGNAIKFTDRGSIEFGFRYQKMGELLFYVKDTGIGIPADKLDVIFDRFRQVEETYTRNYEGTGLGLAISKKFTELLGGEMWVESELNVGTTFYFSLPFTLANSEEKKPPKVNSNNELLSWKGKNILVVEDEDSNFSLIDRMLKVKDVNVFRASDGEQAVDYVDENYQTLDLILMDIKIPGLNGYEASQIIKEKQPRIPIIAQTAYAINGEREKCIQAGCDDYVSKPIDRMELFLKIEKHLS